MAKQDFKIAINAAKFPYLYSRAGRAVLQPGFDQAPRTNVNFVGSAERFDYNLIQLLYAENVLPIAEGLLSVGTQQDIEPYEPATTDFDLFLTLRDAEEQNYLFSPGRGKNYVYNTTLAAWESIDPFVWDPAKTIVSKIYVDGRTFIVYEKDRIIEYDPIGNSFTTIAVTLPAGYTMANIRMGCGASNYAILATLTEILWSSTTDVTNFDDPVGKSGKQTPIDLKGQITAVVPISGGFIIYTTRNAVAAFFTNNPNTPFTYREVQGSGGIPGYEQVTGDANQAEHYTYGSSGLQVVNLQRADLLLPDCADFLSGKDYEYWDPVNKTVIQTVLVGALEVKLQLLGNRYLVISYGKIAGQFTFALMYDVALRSVGKVRVNHVDVTVLPSSVMTTIPLRYSDLTGPYDVYDIPYDELYQVVGDTLPLRAGFAFLQNTGAIMTLQAESANATPAGVALFGHVQVTRGRTVSDIRSQFDGLWSIPLPTVTLLGSAPGNGYNRTTAQELILDATTVTDKQIAYYGSNLTWENFDLALEGKFVLTTGLQRTTIHGSR